jgi:DNA-binding MarR family transcriptional regulator
VPPVPLSTLLSQVLVAQTIELDNEFEVRLAESGESARVTSVVMWSNFLRFVGDGITVGDLAEATGLPKARVLSNLGGMERWRYVFVAPAPAERPPSEKRDGWGSARALRADGVVRPTAAGRASQATWPALFSELEEGWEQRFGAATLEELRSSSRAIVARLDVDLPEYVPIVAGSDGMVAGVTPRARSGPPKPSHLNASLAQIVLAYTLDFEAQSELSLALSANFARVLDEEARLVRDILVRAGVSKEATAIALGCLTKAGHATQEGSTAATKYARLTAKGSEVQRRLPDIHARVEEAWRDRFGADEVARLRSALGVVLAHADLSEGLRPPPGGWRASKPYRARTEALLEDPSAALPHYPLVLHRGGWPDGS